MGFWPIGGQPHQKNQKLKPNPNRILLASGSSPLGYVLCFFYLFFIFIIFNFLLNKLKTYIEIENSLWERSLVDNVVHFKSFTLLEVMFYDKFSIFFVPIRQLPTKQRRTKICLLKKWFKTKVILKRKGFDV